MLEKASRISNADSEIVISDWIMVVTLVSKPLLCISCSLVDSLSVVVCSFRYCCHLCRQSWRSSSSLLLDARHYRVRYQSRLDQPAVQHHVFDDRENVRFLPDITISWAFIGLAKVVSLCQPCLELRIRLLDCNLHICSM